MRGNPGDRTCLKLAVMVLLLLTVCTAVCGYLLMPKAADVNARESWEGTDLLKEYEKNHDLAGWLQVEGTTISYPVMQGEAYLFKDFSGDYDVSGSLFVEDEWAEEDLCTLIYGHNMWMYGTMFHPLCKFTESGFFEQNRRIKFYVIKGREGPAGELSAEKRTYEILACIRTSVDEWNFAGCQYISDPQELDRFLDDCRARSLYQREADAQNAIVLCTCSYHTKGKTGRLLLVGALRNVKEQTRIDKAFPARK